MQDKKELLNPDANERKRLRKYVLEYLKKNDLPKKFLLNGKIRNKIRIYIEQKEKTRLGTNLLGKFLNTFRPKTVKEKNLAEIKKQQSRKENAKQPRLHRKPKNI